MTTKATTTTAVKATITAVPQKTFKQKLFEVQNKISHVSRNAQGHKYKYANLEAIANAINPIFEEVGLAWRHEVSYMVVGENVHDTLTTIIFDETDEYSTTLIIPNTGMAGQNVYQAFGSGITYYKRYSLMAILGIVVDDGTDNDGEYIKPEPISTPPPAKLKSVEPEVDPLQPFKVELSNRFGQLSEENKKKFRKVKEENTDNPIGKMSKKEIDFCLSVIDKLEKQHVYEDPLEEPFD